MKKFLENKKVVLVIFGVLLLFAVFIFLFAGRFLDYSQKPVHSDVLIVLGGGGEEREIAAGHLFKSGFAKHVILSDGGSRFNPSLAYADQEKRWLLEGGIPESVIIADRKSRSTYANAVIGLQIMKHKHFRSATVISSTYHMRRAKYIFDKVFGGQAITLR
ncbi:YdcF family protein [Terrilactibacillus sp. S3-3]|nr:YdcF family protein [Terrilactibacillus sp. S3-3]